MTPAECLPGALRPRPRLSIPRSVSRGHRIGDAVQDVWRGYWRRRAERATRFLLRSLDDRTLKDLGIHRSEIESVACCGRDRRRGWDEDYRATSNL
jgi:uncharacterized protein YjiS (DUF1127 family)